MEVWLSYDCPYELAQHRVVQGLAVVNKEILGTIEVACAPPMLSNAYEAVWNQCTIVMALIKQGIQSLALLNIGGAPSYIAFFWLNNLLHHRVERFIWILQFICLNWTLFCVKQLKDD